MMDSDAPSVPSPMDEAVRELLRSVRLPETPENIAKVLKVLNDRMPERAGP